VNLFDEVILAPVCQSFRLPIQESAKLDIATILQWDFFVKEPWFLKLRSAGKTPGMRLNIDITKTIPIKSSIDYFLPTSSSHCLPKAYLVRCLVMQTYWKNTPVPMVTLIALHKLSNPDFKWFVHCSQVGTAVPLSCPHHKNMAHPKLDEPFLSIPVPV